MTNMNVIPVSQDSYIVNGCKVKITYAEDGDSIMILRSSSMFHWRSLKNLRVIHSRCVLRVDGKRTLNKHPLGGWVLRMGESSFLTKLLVKL